VTILLPILGEFIFSNDLTFHQSITLIGFYTPYLVIPAIFTIYLINTEVPFAEKEKSR